MLTLRIIGISARPLFRWIKRLIKIPLNAAAGPPKTGEASLVKTKGRPSAYTLKNSGDFGWALSTSNKFCRRRT